MYSLGRYAIRCCPRRRRARAFVPFGGDVTDFRRPLLAAGDGCPWTPPLRVLATKPYLVSMRARVGPPKESFYIFFLYCRCFGVNVIARLIMTAVQLGRTFLRNPG